MHRSRFAGIIIDCQTADLDEAATFWSAALGYPKQDRSADDGPYIGLEAPENETYVEVQSVEHESRVHLDIEADDVEAEVLRLEGLGATRIVEIRGWWVMQAPTGQRFCVVPPANKHFDATANRWP
ncbi:MAG: VOC family protein [Gammaproteobacteria bacterium]|nr:VOC family protein [Gammaproteobacteria bacterium]